MFWTLGSFPFHLGSLFPHIYIYIPKPCHFQHSPTLDTTSPKNSLYFPFPFVSILPNFQVAGDRSPELFTGRRHCSQHHFWLPHPFFITSTPYLTSLPSSNILHTPSTTSPTTFPFHSLTSTHHLMGFINNFKF